MDIIDTANVTTHMNWVVPPPRFLILNSMAMFILEKVPKKWQEYCKFALVWNGNIAFEEDNSVGLSSEVKECGCLFVGTAKEMVCECPGLELFEFFPQITPP